jgi:hypothetical protein
VQWWRTTTTTTTTGYDNKTRNERIGNKKRKKREEKEIIQNERRELQLSFVNQPIAAAVPYSATFFFLLLLLLFSCRSHFSYFCKKKFLVPAVPLLCIYVRLEMFLYSKHTDGKKRGNEDNDVRSHPSGRGFLSSSPTDNISSQQLPITAAHICTLHFIFV